jgi:hypothetical protein
VASVVRAGAVAHIRNIARLRTLAVYYLSAAVLRRSAAENGALPERAAAAAAASCCGGVEWLLGPWGSGSMLGDHKNIVRISYRPTTTTHIICFCSQRPRAVAVV